MICGLQVTGALLNIAVVSRKKKRSKNMYQSGASQLTKALVEANIEDYTMEFFLFNETCVPYHVIIVKLNFGTEFHTVF